MPELKQLANEMRQLVLEKDAAISGHVGPNLGAMEATIAFHYVFDSPKDKIIWDISHLAYGHKMLTGRKEAFLDTMFQVTVLLMKANMTSLRLDILLLQLLWQ